MMTNKKPKTTKSTKPPDRAGEDVAAQQYECVRRAPRGFSTVEHYPLRYPHGRRRSEVAGTHHLYA